MPKLLFFTRVAFLCNCCFALALMIHYIPFISNGIIPSTLIIAGNVLAIVVNILIHMLYIILLTADRRLSSYIPLWLLFTNFLFLIVQLILLLK